MSKRRQEWPRFSRAEIRSFANELDRGGWTYEGIDTNGHTIWRHPAAAVQYKLPSTPSHFSVQGARRDVAKLLGQKPAGKRNGKPKAKPVRRDFATEQALRQAKARPAAAKPTPPAAPVPAAPVARPTPKRLPWEDQPDNYDRGLARMMREVPHR